MTGDDLQQRVNAELQAHLDQQHSVSLWMYSHEAYTLTRLIQVACRQPDCAAF